MTHSRVLCLGEILFDCLADQPGRPLEAVETWTPYPGGAPANVACALVKLGTPAAFIGAVGGDTEGHALVELLETIGVDTTGIQRHPTAPTRQIYVVRSEAGERTFAGFGTLKTTEFADTFLQASALPESLFVRADFLVLGTLEWAYPDSQSAIVRALKLAKKHGVKILLDVNWRPMFWSNLDDAKAAIYQLIEQADFVKLSEEEADWLFETADAREIARRYQLTKGILVTAGEKGSAYCFGKTEGHIPAFAIEVADTTGAGDSFVAGFLHQLVQRGIQSLENPQMAQEIVIYANAVGAITATKPGAIAAQPTATEVTEFLSDH